jgi:hypothetical protein
MNFSQLRRAFWLRRLSDMSHSLHLVEEPPQAGVITRDCEVVQMPLQHPFGIEIVTQLISRPITNRFHQHLALTFACGGKVRRKMRCGD